MVRFYSSPLFRKDCPHLLKKRRVGVKAAQRQEEDNTEGLGSPAEAESTSGPPEELLSPAEHQREQQQELVGGQEHRRPPARDRSKSAPPAPVKSESALPGILREAAERPPTHRGCMARRPHARHSSSLAPFAYCPVCHCFLGLLPPMAGRPDCPYSAP
ncbi:unnamed protein product [Nyctereutes procyonoides]|uniref:(raccoon dog) hypothetical protein n=1 Tax=Nyctereutes procyonoides TaxID=34880 RepID=A0A811XQ35_NYCPR|nr:unnamed protein product [Nyctereutes procyonoides]